MACVKDLRKDSKLVLRNIVDKEDGKRQYEYLWSMNNWDKLETNMQYQSHRIVIGGVEHNFCLHRIQKDSRSSDNPSKFFVQLVMKLVPSVSDDVDVCFSVMDHSNNIFPCDLSNDGSYVIEEEFYLTMYAKFLVVCCITLPSTGNASIYIDQPLTEVKNYISLSDNLNELLEGLKYSDVKIAVGDKEFDAHRCILAARSKVFAKLFDADLNVASQKTIVVEICPEEVFYDFLRYLYSGKLETFSMKSAFYMVLLGATYAVKKLKSDAASYLIKHLNIHNVLDLYTLSELSKTELLKVATLEFITKNLFEVMKNPKWEEFIVSDSSMRSLLTIVAKHTDENVQTSDDYRPDFTDADMELKIKELENGVCQIFAHMEILQEDKNTAF